MLGHQDTGGEKGKAFAPSWRGKAEPKPTNPGG